MDVLRELIDSRYTVYDVLPTFFNLTDQEIIHGKCPPPRPCHIAATDDIRRQP